MGARYTLTIRDEEFQVLGPADVQPGQIVLSRRIEELDSTALGDRLIIVGISKRLQGYESVFTSLAGQTAQEVDRTLDSARNRGAQQGLVP